MPPHRLLLQIGSPIILMRNLDPSIGACNSSRMTIVHISTYLLTARIMHGAHKGQMVYIPRMNLTTEEGIYAFVLTRRQFPVRPAFAMTINKSQGQTFDLVGIYLPECVFAHGQLYVALSRVGAFKKIIIFIENSQKMWCTKRSSKIICILRQTSRMRW